jgi:hypothetical protein
MGTGFVFSNQFFAPYCSHLKALHWQSQWHPFQGLEIIAAYEIFDMQI